MIMTGSGIVVDPSGPVDVGNRVCVNASSSFSVQLNCQLTNPNESHISNITWSPGGSTQRERFYCPTRHNWHVSL